MPLNKDGEKKEDLSPEAPAQEDPRYYVECPARKNKARIPIVKCFGCEFATGYEIEHWPGTGKAYVEIGCGFPNSTRSKRRTA